MDPIAVSTINITPELFQESFAVVFDRKKQKTLLICGIVFSAFGILFLLVQYVLNQVIVLGGPVLVMGLFVIGWSFLLPRSECKRKYKIMTQKNGGSPILRTVSFFETNLTVERDGAVLADIDYSEVKDWKETEHLIVLLCEDRTGVLVDRKSLPEAVIQQIRSFMTLPPE